MATSKEKRFRSTKFTPEVVRQAVESISPKGDSAKIDVTLRVVDVGEAEWSFDNDDEFFALYRKDETSYALYMAETKKPDAECRVTFSYSHTTVSVTMPTRAEVERVFQWFESAALACRFSEERR